MLKKIAIFKILIAAFFTVLVLGCLSKNPSYQDYTLVTASELAKADIASQLPKTLGVFPVVISGWLDKKNITWSGDGVRLKSSSSDRWGEPLPELLTQTMVQNVRSQVGVRSWVSSGPWVYDKKPEIIIFSHVNAISIDDRILSMDLSWSLENQDKSIIAKREKTYSLAQEESETTQAYVKLLSQVWGLVAQDIVKTLHELALTTDGQELTPSNSYHSG